MNPPFFSSLPPWVSSLLEGVDLEVWGQALDVWVIFSTLGMLVLVLVLGVLTIVLRLVNGWRQRHERRLHERWRVWLFDFYLHPQAPSLFVSGLALRDYRKFGNFLRPYLGDVLGEERGILLTLVGQLPFEAYLRGELSSGRAWRRAWAVSMIGLLDYRELLPQIRPLLNDPARFVRQETAALLMKLRDQSSVEGVLKRFSGPDYQGDDQAVLLLMEYGMDILPLLATMYREAELTVTKRRILLTLFKQYQYTEMTWDLITSFDEITDPECRYACLSALEAMEDPVLGAFFEGLIHNPDPNLASIAARALGKVGGVESLPFLRQALYSGHFWVVMNAAFSLTDLQSKGLAVLRAEWDQPHAPLTRQIIAEALQHAGHWPLPGTAPGGLPDPGSSGLGGTYER